MSEYNQNCSNCGKNGHLFQQCKYPITSVGIIAFRKVWMGAVVEAERDAGFCSAVEINLRDYNLLFLRELYYSFAPWIDQRGKSELALVLGAAVGMILEQDFIEGH